MPRPDYKNCTETIANFISSFTPGMLPPEVVAMNATLVLDGTGALVAATNPAYSTGRLITEFVREQGGKPVASVLGGGFKTSPTMAALANGTMGYACDIEPHHPEAILHPVAVMIPSALAIGESVGASGAQFLAAVALGLEIEYRVSTALGPAALYERGFHPSAVCGTFGAAASAAYLLRMDRETVTRTLGLAGCQASGLMAWQSDPTENARPFQMGMAARNGVTAALLADAGFGGPLSIFDEGHTIFKAFSDDAWSERLIEGLGEKWDGLMEMALKPYPCVSFLHPGLDAMLGLARAHGLRACDVANLTLRFPEAGLHCVNNNPLRSHCAQYILPVALINNGLEVSDIFIDRRDSDPELAALCSKVTVRSDPELDVLFPDFYASIVEITTNDGRTLTRRMDVARGYPEQPLTAQEVNEKFRALAGSVLNEDQVDRLNATIVSLAEAASLDTYADLLRGSGGGHNE